MRRSLGEKGLTLVEALAAATLMSLIIIGSLLLYERGVRTWSWTEQEAEVVDNLRIAVDKIVYELRGATDIMNPEVGPSGGTLLEFKDASEATVKYYLHNKALRRNENNQPVTTEVVTAVYFSRDAPRPALVRIELWGKGQGTHEVSVRTMAYAANLQ